MLRDITHIDITLDGQLKEISGLTWLPWIGCDYQMNKYSDRILIVGESHYDWHDNESKLKLENKNFTRFVIEEQGLSHLSDWQQKEGEWYWRLVRNLEKTFLGKEPENDNKIEYFWHSVAFYNLVQIPMETIGHRPTKADYERGWQVFFKLIKVIQPSHCLILGTENNKINQFNSGIKNFTDNSSTISWGEKVGRAYMKYIDLDSESLPKSKILFIKHPSSFFSWIQWSKVLEQEMPSFITQFRKI